MRKNKSIITTTNDFKEFIFERLEDLDGIRTRIFF